MTRSPLTPRRWFLVTSILKVRDGETCMATSTVTYAASDGPVRATASEMIRRATELVPLLAARAEKCEQSRFIPTRLSRTSSGPASSASPSPSRTADWASTWTPCSKWRWSWDADAAPARGSAVSGRFTIGWLECGRSRRKTNTGRIRMTPFPTPRGTCSTVRSSRRAAVSGFQAIGTSRAESTMRAGRCCSSRGRGWRWCRRRISASSTTGT